MSKRALLLMLCVVLFGCGRSFTEDFSDRKTATPAFQDEFGFDPPPEIKEIRGKVLQQGDTFARWLEFSYDKAALSRILSKDWKEASRAEIESGAVWSQALKLDNPNAPTWWPKQAVREGPPIYYTEKPHDSGARHYAFMIIDVSSGTVFSKSCIWQ